MRYRDAEHKLLARSVLIPEGEPNAGCWMWMGRLEKNGYAKLGVYEGGGREQERVRNYWVHRLAYETFHCASIPDGYVVMHLCNNRWCIAPAHLTVGTQSENMLQCVREGRHNSQFTKEELEEFWQS